MIQRNTRSSLVLIMWLLTNVASAHDFWVEPASYRPALGTELSVRLRIGDAFAGLAYRRNPEHIKGFFLIGPGGKKPVDGAPGSEPAGSVRIDEPGLLIVGYHSAQTMLELEAKRFEAYLKEEEFTHVLRARAQQRRSKQPGREAFSRYAKAMLMSGPSAERGFDRILGFALELVPELNPYTLEPGDELPLRILYMGKPLAGVRVIARNAGEPANKITVRSDLQGRVRLKLHRHGVWLIRGVHITPAPEGVAADWESFWASLTFELPRGG